MSYLDLNQQQQQHDEDEDDDTSIFPRLVLICGSAGTDTSNVGWQLAHHNLLTSNSDKPQCISTDTICTVLQGVISPDINPALHCNPVDFSLLQEDTTSSANAVENWQNACSSVESSLERVVEAHLHLHTLKSTLVVHGPHLTPTSRVCQRLLQSWKDQTGGGDAMGVVLYIENQDLHRQQLQQLLIEQEEFQRVRSIQDEMMAQARQAGWLLLSQDNTSNDLLVEQVLEHMKQMEYSASASDGATDIHIDSNAESSKTTSTNTETVATSTTSTNIPSPSASNIKYRQTVHYSNISMGTGAKNQYNKSTESTVPAFTNKAPKSQGFAVVTETTSTKSPTLETNNHPSSTDDVSRKMNTPSPSESSPFVEADPQVGGDSLAREQSYDTTITASTTATNAMRTSRVPVVEPDAQVGGDSLLSTTSDSGAFTVAASKPALVRRTTAGAGFMEPNPQVGGESFLTQESYSSRRATIQPSHTSSSTGTGSASTRTVRSDNPATTPKATPPKSSTGMEADDTTASTATADPDVTTTTRAPAASPERPPRFVELDPLGVTLTSVQEGETNQLMIDGKQGGQGRLLGGTAAAPVPPTSTTRTDTRLYSTASCNATNASTLPSPPSNSLTQGVRLRN